MVAVDGTFFRRWGRQGGRRPGGPTTGPRRAGRRSRSGTPGWSRRSWCRLPFCPSPGGAAGAVPAVARQGHRLPGAARRGADEAAGEGVPRPGGARHRGRRLPRGGPGHRGHNVDDAAAVERGAVRAEAAADREARPAAGERETGSAPARRPRSTLTWEDTVIHVYGKDENGADRLLPGAVARQLQVRARPARPGPRPGLPKSPMTWACSPSTPTRPRPAIAGRYSWRWPIEPSNAAGQAAPRRRRRLQPHGEGRRAHRPVRVPHPGPADHLVRPLRLRPRRHRPPPPRSARGTGPRPRPSAADMLARLRRELREARISATRPGQDHLGQIDLDAWTCDTIAA